MSGQPAGDPLGSPRATHGDELPKEISALCSLVARRTRLRRWERLDVARELASHFRDALAAGRSPADAIAAFGDPIAAARELRAAAIAKRSPIDRAFGRALRFTAFTVAGLAIAYASFGVYLHLQVPRISVDTVAKFRARLAVPPTPDAAAWPAYRTALLALGRAVDDPDLDSAGWNAVQGGARPGTESWKPATDWLAAHQSAIAMLRDAAARPVFAFPAAAEFTEEDARLFGSDAARAMSELLATRDDPRKFPMVGILLPHLVSMRSAARVACADATLAADTGDGERAAADLEAAMRMSVHVQDGRVLIGDLVGIAIRSLARYRAIELLETYPGLWDAAQLERLQQALGHVPPGLDRMELGAERLMWIDLEQRLFTDDGHGNGWFRLDRDSLQPLVGAIEQVSAPGPTGGGSANPRADWSFGTMAEFALATTSGPAAAIVVGDRRETREFFDRWSERVEHVSELPVRERAEILRVEKELGDEIAKNPTRFLLPRLMMPALARAAFSMSQDRAWASACATVFAAARYRRDNGRWPSAAEDLVPTYLAPVPEDPWSGRPVRMQGADASFRIWSVGEDRSDGGGAPDADDGRNSPAATTLCFRDSPVASGHPDPASPPTDIDWVWFSASGNGDRWRRER